MKKYLKNYIHILNFVYNQEYFYLEIVSHNQISLSERDLINLYLKIKKKNISYSFQTTLLKSLILASDFKQVKKHLDIIISNDSLYSKIEFLFYSIHNQYSKYHQAILRKEIEDAEARSDKKLEKDKKIVNICETLFSSFEKEIKKGNVQIKNNEIVERFEINFVFARYLIKILHKNMKMDIELLKKINRVLINFLDNFLFIVDYLKGSNPHGRIINFNISSDNLNQIVLIKEDLIKETIKHFEVMRFIKAIEICFEKMIFIKDKFDETPDSNNHNKDLSTNPSVRINNLFKKNLKTNNIINDNSKFFLEYLINKIIRGNDNKNQSSFKNILQVRNVNFMEIIFKLFQLDPINFQRITLKLMKDENNKYRDIFLNYIEITAIFFVFANFLNIFNLNERYFSHNNLDSIIFLGKNIKFLQNLCENHNRDFQNALYNIQLNPEKTQHLYDDGIKSKVTNKIKYNFIDLIFLMMSLLQRKIKENLNLDNSLFLKLHTDLTNLMVEMIQGATTENINYFSLFSNREEFIEEKFYFIQTIVDIEKIIINKEINLNTDIIAISSNMFRIINTLSQLNHDKLGIVLDLQIIFSPFKVVELIIYYHKYLILQFNYKKKQITNKDIEAVILTKEENDKLFEIYLKDDKFFNSDHFNLICNLYCFLRMNGDRLKIKLTDKLFKLVSKLKLSKARKKLKDEFVGYKNRLLEIMNYHFFEDPNLIKQIVKDPQTKLSIEFYFKIILDCEFIFRGGDSDLNKDYLKSGTLKKVYFIQKPMLHHLNIKSITEYLNYIDYSCMTNRISEILDNIKLYQIEVDYRHKFINKSEFNKFLMNVDYTKINIINIIISSGILMILLYCLNIRTVDDPFIYIIIRLVETGQILFNMTYITFYLLSKYKLNILLDINNELSKINLYFIQNILLNEDVSFLILNMILSFIILFYPFLFGLICLQLLTVIKFIPTIKEIFLAFYMNGSSLIGMLGLLTILVYFFTNFSFFFLHDEFNRTNEKGESQNQCEYLFYCLIYLFNDAVRAGGGLGDLLKLKSIKFLIPYTLRYLIDLIFFVLIVLLILNMINGIIVNTFSEMREDREKIESEYIGKCFICLNESEEFEKRNIKFDDHIKFEHNLFNYIKYFIDLELIDPLDRDSDQSEIYSCIEDRDFRFIPYGKSGSIGNNINTDIKNQIQNTIN